MPQTIYKFHLFFTDALKDIPKKMEEKDLTAIQKLFEPLRDILEEYDEKVKGLILKLIPTPNDASLKVLQTIARCIIVSPVYVYYTIVFGFLSFFISLPFDYDVKPSNCQQLWNAKLLENRFEFISPVPEATHNDDHHGEIREERFLTIPRSAVKPRNKTTGYRSKVPWYLCMIIGCFPFIVIGSLSGFKNGESSTAQRAWTLTWLVVGVVIGLLSYEVTNDLFNPLGSQSLSVYKIRLFGFLVFLTYGAPTIGGMIVVGQMLVDYGSCRRMY